MQYTESVKITIFLCVMSAYGYAVEDALIDRKSQAALRLKAAEQHALAQVHAQRHSQRFTQWHKNNVEQARVLSDAFAQLPKNATLSDQSKKSFYKKIERELPDEIMERIGSYSVSNDRPRLVSQGFIHNNLKSLIPCLIPKRILYPDVQSIIKSIEIEYASVVRELGQQPQHNRFIVATMGFWSFFDEPSKLRFIHLDEHLVHQVQDNDQARDLMTWFQLYYGPGVRVKELNKDEFVGVLYSDGTVQWEIGSENKEKLKRLRKEYIDLGIKLGSGEGRMVQLDDTECEIYEKIPTWMKRNVKTNQLIKMPKNSAHRFVQIAELVVPFLFWGYVGYKYLDYWPPATSFIKEGDGLLKQSAIVVGKFILGYLPRILLQKAIERSKRGKNSYRVPSRAVNLLKAGRWTRMLRESFKGTSLTSPFDLIQCLGVGLVISCMDDLCMDLTSALVPL